jgi:hypothetical protein
MIILNSITINPNLWWCYCNQKERGPIPQHIEWPNPWCNPDWFWSTVTLHSDLRAQQHMVKILILATALDWSVAHHTHKQKERKTHASIHCFPALPEFTDPNRRKNILHFIHRLITIREHKLSSSGHLSPKTPSFLVTTSSSSSFLDLLQQNDHAKVTRRSGKKIGPWLTHSATTLTSHTPSFFFFLS